jgi:hypothetical protein
MTTLPAVDSIAVEGAAAWPGAVAATTGLMVE